MKNRNKYTKTIWNKHLNDLRIARKVMKSGPITISADTAPPLNYSLHTGDDGKEYWVKDVDFIKNFQRYAFGMARKVNLDEANVGVLDANDILEESYAAYIYSASMQNFDKVESDISEDEKKYVRKGYIHDTSKQRLRIQINNKKDGMRLTNWKTFQSKDKFEKNIFTEFFPDLVELFEDLDDDGWNRLHEMVKKDIVRHISRLTFDDHKSAYIIKASYGIGIDSNGNPYTSGHSQKVIARAMGLTVKAVERLKAKSIEKLRDRDIKEYIVNAFMEWRIPMSKEMWIFYKEIHFLEGDFENTVSTINWRELEKEKYLDRKGSHYSYTDHAIRVHGEIPTAEETFANRDAAMKSLLDIEMEKTLRVLEGSDYEDYSSKSLFVVNESDSDEFEDAQNMYID